MANEASDKKEPTRLVQAVVPISTAAKIDVDAEGQGRSVSNTVARILVAHYAKRGWPSLKKAS